MKLRNKLLPLALALSAAAALVSAPAQAANAYDVYISEWMYKGVGPNDGFGEFVEFTNFGTSAVNFTGWSFDDDSRAPLSFRLSAFGSVAAGESVIITQMGADQVRARWGLEASVKVIGGYSNNLGNGDEINLFDANQQLVDRLTYGSNPRTLGRSGHVSSLASLGANQANQWVLSSINDVEGSWAANTGDIGSPGYTSFAAPVPEPSTLAMLLAGFGVVGAVARRKQKAE